MKSLVSERFGKYEIKRLLGKGGMGEVYEAYDTTKGRTVALKVLTDRYAEDESYRARFLRESRAAAILQEPHARSQHSMSGNRTTVPGLWHFARRCTTPTS